MTFEEIKAALEADKDLQNQVVIWSKDTEKGKEVLANFAEAEFEKKYAEKHQEDLGKIENAISEVIGTKRGENESVNDYLVKVSKELKAKADAGGGDDSEKVKELQKEIKDLKEKGASNEFYKKEHEALENKFKTFKEEKEGEISNLKKEHNEFIIGGQLKAGLSGLKFKEGIPQAMIDAMVKEQTQTMLGRTQVVDGKLVLLNENGETMRNDDLSSMTPSDFWKSKLKDALAEAQGGGADPDPKKAGIKTIPGDDGKDKKVLTLDPSKFNTKYQFNQVAEKALAELGVTKSDPAYAELKNSAYESYGVKEMSLQ